MAHWNEIRDQWRVEQARAISYAPRDLIDRFEETGDNDDWERVIDFLRTRRDKKVKSCEEASKSKGLRFEGQT